MSQDGVKVGAAFVDDRREADDFGTGADYDKKFKAAVVLKMNVAIVEFRSHNCVF